MLFLIAAAFATSNPSIHAEKAADGRHEITDRFDERVSVGRTSAPDGSDRGEGFDGAQGSDGIVIDAQGPGGIVTRVLSPEDLTDPEVIRGALDDVESVLVDLPDLMRAEGMDLCADVAGLDTACPW